MQSPKPVLKRAASILRFRISGCTNINDNPGIAARVFTISGAAGPLFESVVVPIQDGRDGRHLLGKQPKIELGVARLHHPAQNAWCIDTPGGSVNGTAIATHFLPMTGRALVLRDQSLSQLEISALIQGRYLRAGRCTDQQEKQGEGGWTHEIQAYSKAQRHANVGGCRGVESTRVAKSCADPDRWTAVRLGCT